MADYFTRQGTISVTSGQTAVTGSGTAFLGLLPGALIFAAGWTQPNVVASISNATTLTLAYPALATLSASAYTAVNMPGAQGTVALIAQLYATIGTAVDATTANKRIRLGTQTGEAMVYWSDDTIGSSSTFRWRAGFEAGAQDTWVLQRSANGTTWTNAFTVNRATGAFTISGLTVTASQISDSTAIGRALVTAADAATVRAAAGATATGSSLITAADAAAVRSVADVYSVAQSDAAAHRAALKNRIVNGAFQHSQERGTAHVDVTTSVSYVVDQWLANLSASPGGTLRCQQVASPTPGGSPNRFRATVQVADTSIAAGDIYGLAHFVEGQFIADARFGSSAARPLVLRFGVNVSFAGTYGFRVANADSSRSWVGTFTVAAGQVGTDLVISVPIPGDTTGTWLADNGVGLQLFVTLAAGTSFHGSAGWQSNNRTTTSAQANFMGATGRTFEIFDVGLYVDHAGTGIAPQWELPDFADELRRCRRYWRNGADVTWRGRVISAVTTGHVTVSFDEPMRTAPVVASIHVASNAFPTTPSAVLGASAFGFDLTRVANANSDDGFFISRYTASARF